MYKQVNQPDSDFGAKIDSNPILQGQEEVMSKHVFITLLGIILVLILTCAASEEPMGYVADERSDVYYAIEQGGVVCGFAHSVFEPAIVSGKPVIRLSDSLWIEIRALGKPIKGQYLFTYVIDSATGMYSHHTSHIEQGGTTLGGEMYPVADSVIIIGEPGSDTSVVHFSPETIFQNTRIFGYLVDFFVNQNLTEKECQVFSEVDGTINDVLYTRLGVELIELNDKDYVALKVKSLDRTTGHQTTIWVDTANGLLLKWVNPIRTTYLTDSGIRTRIKEADLDEHIFANVDTMITNPWAISYMKVRARLQPGGTWITPEGLNVPGQRFEGTVEDNLIEGTFEIDHPRYSGENAPPFPPDFSQDESLQQYLEPSDLIESDDPDVVKYAREITSGAKDAWEALTRLSKWVNEEIGYDLPGGITAAKTLETRVGECGSHSNLLAGFCRAVGIPARCVFGCMYIPEHGGVFGQHAWNEIYMGEAGWIPVDATVDEMTYVDCGHIRLGEWVSKAMMLNPDEMEIVEYTVGEGTYADLVKSSGIDYNLYVGKYQGPERILTISIEDNRLALDIPGKMVFQLKDLDEHGEWFFALSDKASVTFEADPGGKAHAMTINSRQYLPRTPPVDSTEFGCVPEQFRGIMGDYTIPMAQVTFTVACKDGKLTLVTPGKRELPVTATENEGEWMADTGESKLVLTFDESEAGEISAMRFSELVRCTKIE